MLEEGSNEGKTAHYLCECLVWWLLLRIELMSQLVRHPQATFFIRIQGDSMRDAGILHGSVVLVDKAIKAQHGNIVIAVVDGDFTCTGP